MIIMTGYEFEHILELFEETEQQHHNHKPHRVGPSRFAATILDRGVHSMFY